MKVGKPKSKRVPVRLRHKIQKASAAKQRKDRKEAKKNPQWRSRLKKDPGIPNLFPYKDKILAEVEEGRRRKEEEAQRRRELNKAQKKGLVVSDTKTSNNAEEDDDGDSNEDEVFYDLEDEADEDSHMQEDSSNPMAALLASAQARAQAFSKDDAEDAAEDEDDEEDTQTAFARSSDNKTKNNVPSRKPLPKQALADPIKTTATLLKRLEKTEHGMQQLLDYYQIPPLVTAGSDANSRFLVDVARKRGRMGRGGVPNLHAAALTVLGDLNEERLRLPALETQAASKAISKGEVQIVTKMAEPFRIEGLFNDSGSKDTAMDLE